MKKLALILVITIVLSLCLIGCGTKQETYDNGVPTYFLEPEGYIIVEIDNGELFSTIYGYILESDFNKYKDGELIGVLEVLNPYTEGKSIVLDTSTIESIATGTYQDARDQND